MNNKIKIPTYSPDQINKHCEKLTTEKTAKQIFSEIVKFIHPDKKEETTTAEMEELYKAYEAGKNGDMNPLNDLYKKYFGRDSEDKHPAKGGIIDIVA